MRAILKRLAFVIRAWWNSQTAPKPKPTREEIQVYYETLDREDFQKWYNKVFPRTPNGGMDQAVAHLVNHPRYHADMEACGRIMDRQRAIEKQKERVYKIVRTKKIRRPGR